MQLKDGTIKDIEINDDNKDLFEFLLEESVFETVRVLAA